MQVLDCVVIVSIRTSVMFSSNSLKEIELYCFNEAFPFRWSLYQRQFPLGNVLINKIEWKLGILVAHIFKKAKNR